MDERLERHLCNLHNEVFEAAESRINTECSLTIREGISRLYVSYDMVFFVPSLYVRVYHVVFIHAFCSSRSLTIREGISGMNNALRTKKAFPHYT